MEIPRKGLKLPVIVTPAVPAAYAWLDKKDTKFDENGVYKVTCPINPEEGEGRIEYGKKAVSSKDFIKHILAECKKYGVPSKPGERACPVKKRDKEEFKGLLLLEPKSGFKPKQVDSTGADLPGNMSVRSGDIVKVAIQPVVREVSGSRFLSMYIAKVMLVEKQEQEVDFGDTEGGFTAPEGADIDFGTEDGDENTDF